MKIFNIIFSIVFVLFAAVQYNDPDPYLWVPIYLYPALLCYLQFIQKPIHKMAYWAGFLLFGAYAIYKMFDTNGIIDWVQFHNASNIASTMKAETPWIEESREFFGLVIILIVLSINYFKENKSQPNQK
ncbi:MAG: transmembrane 220 family protein [Chitinophagaceae bacterium]|nr:transmembrane 220 family protein [Chitinophagaceae bacterium]